MVRTWKGATGRVVAENEKPLIFGRIQRSGEVMIRMLPNVKQDSIKLLILKMVLQGTQIVTDEYTIYSRLPAWGFLQRTVNRSAGEYARDEDGDGCHEVHSNTIEGVWSLCAHGCVRIAAFRKINYHSILAFSSSFTMSENAANACYPLFWKYYSVRPWNPYIPIQLENTVLTV
jgi:hypothetical protein